MKIKTTLLIGLIFLVLISLTAVNANENTTFDEILTVEDPLNENILADGGGDFKELSEMVNGDETTLNLEKNYKYSPGDEALSDGITVSKPVTINGNGYTIDASGSARIFNIQSSNVVINNVRFINAHASNEGGALIVTGSNVTINNCTFENNTADGSAGAVYFSGANGIVNNTIFKSNTASTSSAGALSWRSAKGTLENSIFESNQAYNAGALFWEGTDGLIRNSTFKSNDAAVAGAIYTYSNVVIDNCTFKRNHANGGGSMYIAGNKATVKNSNFEFESAAYGGSIWFYTPNVVIENSTFKSCKATRGGAIYANNEYATIHNCNFENNSASKGGSIYVSSNHLTVTNSSFHSDSAVYHGGSIFFNAKNCNIDGCNFTNGYASAGGGVYLVYDDTDTGVVSGNYISNSRFINNTARYGGAGVSATGKSVINNSVFANNSAGNYGGAVDLTNSKLINSILENNTAIFGGAIFMYNSDIADSTFTGNRATVGDAMYILNMSNLDNNIVGDDEIFVNEKETRGIVIGSSASSHNIASLMETDQGYLAFCVERYNTNPYAGVYDHSMEKLKNSINHEPVGEYLKILIYNFVEHIDDLKSSGFHNYVWAFSDGKYWESEDPIVKEVIRIYDSGFRVPSQNACKVLANGTLMYLNFSSMITPSGQQNLFLFKFNHEGEINETLDKEVLNKTAIVGDSIEYRIVISNKGNMTVYDNFIEDKDYSNGLVYITWRAEEGNWSYDNLTGQWKLPSLDGGKSASIILVFKVFVNGTLYNNATSGVGYINVTNSSDVIKVYNPNLTVEKHSLTPTVELGDKARFEIIVKNTGDIDLGNVTVTESSHEGLVFDHAEKADLWDESLVNGKHTWKLKGNLSVGAVERFIVVFNTTAAGNFTNIVIAGSNKTENRTSNNTTRVVSSNFTISKITITPKVTVGEEAVFEIIVRNTGDLDLQNLTVIESKYDSGLVYLRFVPVKGNWEHVLDDDGKHKFTLLGNLSIGDSASFRAIFNTTKTGNLSNTVTLNNTNSTNTTEVVNETPENNNTRNYTIPEPNIKIDTPIIEQVLDSEWVVVEKDKTIIDDNATGNPLIALLLALISIPLRRFRK